ncbi:MAG: lysophospholipid acyltransferase family protein [Eubacteriales bacterium]|nr:lysophospholipid acyltransferase family protein [Eubacteriales bacterium]
MLYYFGKFFIAPFIFIFFRPRIKGYKNMFRRGKVIYVCNHFSLADPLYIGIVAPRIIRFMAKASLFASKLGNLLFKSMMVFPVHGKTADLKSVRRAIDTLNKGQAFGIFPEGHRSPTGDMDHLEKGAAFIALRAKAPIVPMYIDPNTNKRVRLRMAVGEVIYPEEVATKNRSSKAVDAVTNAIHDAFITLRAQTEQL